MRKNGALRLLVVSDIHYGIDYKSKNDTEDKFVMGGWGPVIMPMIVEHAKGFDAVLDAGDTHTAYD